ncbi:MAG: aminomethyl-transferring glycine dehydrogenase subunit GcvPA [Armatimonadetes bacterium]|nr:aminomethyl-transferring glycine dehydrogenase subunit GcvPA [Armatimonadota bacterium]
MRYIPHTDADRREMLKTIGVSSIENLFEDIPPELRLQKQLNIPGSLDEYALVRELSRISAENLDPAETVSFLGAGVYEHYVPATVMELVSRGEFLTAYTPYQPEMSQGYLQTIYEFQSLICEITGMDVANASMYDGATAAAEAVLMASGINKRKRALVCDSLHPHYRECIRTFADSLEIEVTEAETRELAALIDDETACVVVQYPDFYGRVRSPKPIIEAAQRHGALAIAVSEPVALGVLPPPGGMGADVMVGEAQPMGVPVGFGGPMVGYFCTKREFVRALPGRIVGKTRDEKGRRGFVMTLRTREQDIRRERATSNICTNQALMGLAVTVWMCALGRNGFRQLAETCVQKAHYAAKQLCRVPGVKLKWPEETFAFEFTLDVGLDAASARDRMLERGYHAGLPLGPYSEDLRNCLLVAVTEVRTREEIDGFATALAKVVN